jgi:hypothetical protein
VAGHIDFALVAPEACRAQGCRWGYTTTDPDFVLAITHNDERVLELIDMVSPDDWRVRNWWCSSSGRRGPAR